MSSHLKARKTDWEDVDWKSNPDQYNSIRESRHTVVYPFLRDKIDGLAPTSVLDFGGGDGGFIRYLRPTITAPISYYDSSDRMAAIARKELGDLENVQVTSDLKKLCASHFDIVTFVAVWMTLRTERECIESLKDIAGLLAPDGTLLAAVTHPCFRENMFSTFYTDFQNRHYSEDGRPFNVFIPDGDAGVVLHDFHWTLSGMSRHLNAAGLKISGLFELADKDTSAGKAAPGYPWLVIAATA